MSCSNVEWPRMVVRRHITSDWSASDIVVYEIGQGGQERRADRQVVVMTNLIQPFSSWTTFVDVSNYARSWFAAAVASIGVSTTLPFVVWPTMSCFADWSKSRHVTLNIIICSYYNVTPGEVTWCSLNANVRYILLGFCLRLVSFFGVLL